MLSVRNLIICSAIVLTATVIVGAISLTRPPDSDGMGGDSYGTRAQGYRALFDTFNELGLTTSRRLEPPKIPKENVTVVFLAPSAELVRAEPTYLKRLLPWVEGGGRIVVVLKDLVPTGPPSMMRTGGEGPTILEILGLSAVDVMNRSVADATVWPRSTTWTPNLKPLEDVWRDTWTTHEIPVQDFAVVSTGAMASGDWPVQKVAGPATQTGTLDASDAKPSGTLDITIAKQTYSLAATFPRGKGEIVLVAEPALFSNLFLAKADNSVLAARLLAPAGQMVIVDEFYHGLSVRGNPLYLLTQPGYAALALGLLLTACSVVWREAVFLGPPLRDETVQRRDIRDYIFAMGRFFAIGHESRRFLVEELREGVLRELNAELSLAPDRLDSDLIAGVLAKRNPQRASALRTAIRESDALLNSPQTPTEIQTLAVMRSLTSCLSKSV